MTTIRPWILPGIAVVIMLVAAAVYFLRERRRRILYFNQMQQVRETLAAEHGLRSQQNGSARNYALLFWGDDDRKSEHELTHPRPKTANKSELVLGWLELVAGVTQIRLRARYWPPKHYGFLFRYDDAELQLVYDAHHHALCTVEDAPWFSRLALPYSLNGHDDRATTEQAEFRQVLGEFIASLPNPEPPEDDPATQLTDDSPSLLNRFKNRASDAA